MVSNLVDAMHYRVMYNITRVEDCSCVAEEVAAGFVDLDDGLQLPLFIGEYSHRPRWGAWDKSYWGTFLTVTGREYRC